MSKGKSAKLANYIEELKKNGLKATKARLAVLACLSESKKPLTPKDLIRKIHLQTGDQTSIDQVSVYRILETFYQIDIVHQIHPGKGYMLCKHHRCHQGMHVLTYCQNCGLAEEKEVPFEILGSMVWYLEKVLQFQPKDHFFQIAGLCEKCVQANDGPPI